jgi:hypothetical protein
MAETEKLICGDCKGITTIRTGKRGSAFIEKILWWTLFFPGIFYSIWRNKAPKKICSYCGSEFLLPMDLPYGQDLLRTKYKNK